MRALLTWATLSKVLGGIIVIEELVQRSSGNELDERLLLLAAGLFGLGSALRKNGK